MAVAPFNDHTSAFSTAHIAAGYEVTEVRAAAEDAKEAGTIDSAQIWATDSAKFAKVKNTIKAVLSNIVFTIKTYSIHTLSRKQRYKFTLEVGDASRTVRSTIYEVRGP